MRDKNFLTHNIQIRAHQSTYQSSQRNSRTIDLAHEESLEDDLVELLVGPASQVAVDLNEEQEIRIPGHGSLSSRLSVMLVIDVDTLD